MAAFTARYTATDTNGQPVQGITVELIESSAMTPGSRAIDNIVATAITDEAGEVAFGALDDTKRYFARARLRDARIQPTMPTPGGGAGVTHHGDLSGLEDDDHPQYLTPAEGNAAYDPIGEADAEVAAHVAAGDPHAGYQKESEKDAASGYCGLDAGALVPDAKIPSGITRDTEHGDFTPTGHSNLIEHADISPAEGFVRKTGAGTYTAHKSNLNAAVDPTANDDSDDGYSVGSVWINTTADKVWQCVDSTVGAAVWKDLSTGGGGSAHTIRNEGVDLAARTGLNFLGGLVNAADDVGGDESEVHVGKQPDGTDLFLTADAAPHLTVGATGKVIRVKDVIEVPTVPVPTAPGYNLGRIFDVDLSGYGFITVPYHRGPLMQSSMFGGALGMMFAPGQLGLWHPREGAHGQVDGIWAGGYVETAATFTDNQQSADGTYTVFQTSAVSGNDAGIQLGTAGSGVHRRESNPYMLIKLQLPSVADIRVFAGFTDQLMSTMVSADNPAGNYWGFSFSTPRADAVWKAIFKNGTTQYVTSSSISPATTAMYILMMNATYCMVMLYDASFNFLGCCLNISGGPLASTRLHGVIGIETQTNSAKSLNLFSARGMNYK